jgi:hypothetical protein
MARLLADKPSHELFGQTEFDLRKIAHRIAAKALEVTLAEKKRLRRGERDLPAVPVCCAVPLLPPHLPDESGG